jgi:hypothetical protein
MAILWSNNASSTVAGSITATATSVALAAGTGVKFPNPTGGDYFCATFYDQATKTINEIVHVTARVGDTCTIVRAQEGTVASAWSAADIFANLVTAGTLEAFVQAGTGPADTSVVYVGTDTSTTPNLIIATTIPVPPSYATGMLFNIKVKNTNTSAVQLQLNGLAGVRASRTNGSDMVGGNLTGSEEMIFVYNGVDFTSMVPPIPQAPPQTTFYVRTDGNDNNTGFANDAADAFATVSGAMFQIKARYISQSQITVRVADGTYIDSFGDSQNYIANWNIVGNTANPGNVVINALSTSQAAYPPYALGAGNCCSSYSTANMTVGGFTFEAYLLNVIATQGGNLNVHDCNFTATTYGFTPINAEAGGFLYLYGNCQYSGATSGECIFEADSGSTILLGYHDPIRSTNLIFNIAGTPVITTATAICDSSACISVSNDVVTFTGGIPNCAQYQCSAGGGILFSTGVTTIFPGTQPGVVIPPGWTSS